jgi:hypothetical protein
MPYFVMPMSVFMSAEAAQSALHLGGRFLLMVSMTWFLSYVLFMIGAVVVSGLLSTARSVRRRLAHNRPAVSGARQSATPMWQVDPTADRHGARA